MYKTIDQSSNAASTYRDAVSPILDLETSLFTTEKLQSLGSSQRHGWEKLYAVHTHEYPHRCLHHSVPFYWLSMCLSDVEIQRSMSGTTELAFLPAYSITLAQPLTPIECRISSETEALHVFIRPELIQEVANEIIESDFDETEIYSFFGQTNKSLSMILRTIKQILKEDEFSSRHQMEYLSRALCADIILKYSRNRGIISHQFGLNLKQRRMIDDYINDNIDKEISSDALASLFSIGRTTLFERFKATYHMPPYQYVLRMRVDKAKQMLKHTACSLTEIGLACGFANQAHFATLFKRFTCVTPSRFRRECT